MKKLVYLSFAFLLSLYFSSCDKTSATIDKTYSVSTIEKVSVQCACDANIYYGATQEDVEVSGSEHLLEKLEVVVDGTTLILRMKPGIYNNMDIVANITIPMIRFIEVNGSGNVWVDDFSSLDDLVVNVSGSGNIRTQDLGLGQNKLTTDISGSGNVEVNGVAGSSYTKISGSGSYEAFGLSISSGNVNISGSGNAELTVSNDLTVDVSGSGSVHYKGQPVINTNISGSGSVVDAN